MKKKQVSKPPVSYGIPSGNSMNCRRPWDDLMGNFQHEPKEDAELTPVSLREPQQ